MTVRFTDDMTVAEARATLKAVEDIDGHSCPVCGQYAKVYNRSINSRQARAAIAMWRTNERDWVHVPTIAGDGCEIGKLRYWGLVEGQGRHTGIWRLTELGERWVRNLVAVPRYAEIYDGECRRLHGPNRGIRDALGNRFSYRELMGLNATPDVPPGLQDANTVTTFPAPSEPVQLPLDAAA